MIKYEYKVIKYRHFNQDESGLSEEQVINEYANEDWELIFPQLYNESYTYLYFKRQINGKG